MAAPSDLLNSRYEKILEIKRGLMGIVLLVKDTKENNEK